jgi:uncharacterized protein
VELAKVRLLGLAQYEERLVLGGNLIRLIQRVRKQPNTFVLAPARAASVPLDEIDPWVERTISPLSML